MYDKRLGYIYTQCLKINQKVSLYNDNYNETFILIFKTLWYRSINSIEALLLFLLPLLICNASSLLWVLSHPLSHLYWAVQTVASVGAFGMIWLRLVLVLGKDYLVCIDTMYYDKYVASQNTTEADVSAALSNSLHCQNFWTLWNCLKSPRYQMCNSWNLAAILD